MPNATLNLTEAFDAAFNAAPGRRDNFVKLSALRAALGIDRATFDAHMNAQRRAGKYTLDKSEGNGVRLTQEDRDAGIIECGEHLVYISRK